MRKRWNIAKLTYLRNKSSASCLHCVQSLYSAHKIPCAAHSAQIAHIQTCALNNVKSALSLWNARIMDKSSHGQLVPRPFSRISGQVVPRAWTTRPMCLDKSSHVARQVVPYIQKTRPKCLGIYNNTPVFSLRKWINRPLKMGYFFRRMFSKTS